MKDKRTYNNLKEHGEDISHENESKTKLSDDRGPLDLTLLTEQYRANLKKYQDRESLYIQTENQLRGSKLIAMEMASSAAKLDRKNQELMKEIDRLNEEVQLLEMQIKKIMRVQDLQEFLSKFTEAKNDGSRQGNAISNAIIMVEVNGYLEKITKMEVHENNTPIVGQAGHSAHRLVLKTTKNLILLYHQNLIIKCSGYLEKHMGPEAKFYQNVKQNFRQFSLIRLENISLLGTPDLLVCNTSGNFCTIELKVTKGNKLRFSPHQIGFHIKHPHNTFILAKALGPLSSKTSPISMYHGSKIEELVTSGLKLDACYSGWDACRLAIEQVGSKA